MTGARAATVPPAMTNYRLLAHSSKRTVRADNTSPRTIRMSLAAISGRSAVLAAPGMPTAPTAIALKHVAAFFTDVLRPARPSPALTRDRMRVIWFRQPTSSARAGVPECFSFGTARHAPVTALCGPEQRARTRNGQRCGLVTKVRRRPRTCGRCGGDKRRPRGAGPSPRIRFSISSRPPGAPPAAARGI